MSRLALALLLAAGCFEPEFDSGQFSCAAAGARCPDDYHCAVDRSCWKNGADPTQLGAFESVSSTALATGRRGPVAAALGPSLWVFGGQGASGALATVERAPISSGGEVGAFAPAGVSESAPRSLAAGLGANGFFWIVGGRSGPSFLASIERAPLDPKGEPGPFAPAGQALANGRAGHAVSLVGAGAGPKLLVIGGRDANGPLASTESAPLDGKSAFAPGPPLGTPRDGAAAVVVDGKFLYVIGGASPTGPLASVEVAPIAADGTLGAFAPAAASLVEARSGHAALVIGRLLYVFGGAGRGAGGDTALDTVERAVIATDGALGPFEALSDVALAHARTDFAPVVIGAHVYLFGGDDFSGAYLTGVERAPAR